MDTRLNTFLSLCETMNYRKTAEKVNLSQPAVTKQIQSLEEEYGIKLFFYAGRKLEITQEGLLVRQYAQSQHYNEQQLLSTLGKVTRRVLRIGATKSIGDSVLDALLAHYLQDEGQNLSMMVANTAELLAHLEAGELDFVVLEGIFEKKKYEVKLLRQEKFVGICPKDHPFAGTVIPMERLEGQNLFLREKGSGTRDILERELKAQGYDLSLFNRVTEISSFRPLKKLVASGLGISFVYQPVVLSEPDIAQFKVEQMAGDHEFNIVWLKHTFATHAVQAFFEE